MNASICVSEIAEPSPPINNESGASAKNFNRIAHGPIAAAMSFGVAVRPRWAWLRPTVKVRATSGHKARIHNPRRNIQYTNAGGQRLTHARFATSSISL